VLGSAGASPPPPKQPRNITVCADYHIHRSTSQYAWIDHIHHRSSARTLTTASKICARMEVVGAWLSWCIADSPTEALGCLAR
jgi:hypothetical protein